jgi:hypothetical protein
MPAKEDQQQDTDGTVAHELGRVAGLLEGLSDRVDDAVVRLGGVEDKLSTGGERFTKIEDTLEGMLEQQKIANGRTSKHEKLLERLGARVGLLEQWRRTVNFLPRAIDKLAEHKVLGLVFTVPLTIGLTLGVQQLLT